jgi:hypothetical protein
MRLKIYDIKNIMLILKIEKSILKVGAWSRHHPSIIAYQPSFVSNLRATDQNDLKYYLNRAPPYKKK